MNTPILMIRFGIRGTATDQKAKRSHKHQLKCTMCTLNSYTANKILIYSNELRIQRQNREAHKIAQKYFHI